MVLGSKFRGSKNRKKAKDGSLTFYIQNESPGTDKEANWLPAPKGDFWVVFRTYGPGKGLIDKTWRPGEIELVK